MLFLELNGLKNYMVVYFILVNSNYFRVPIIVLLFFSVFYNGFLHLD